MKNLRNSFPEKTKDDLAKIERQFYHNLCDYGVETLKLLTIKEAELKRRFSFINEELVEKYATEKHSVIYLAGHQFNWEWGMVSASATFPMALDFVYQKVRNEFFNNLILACRSRFGAYAIERKTVARESVSRKQIVRGIAIVADQYPGRAEDKRFISHFLNQETAFYLGTNQLVQLTQYPVLFYHLKKVKRGYYEATIMELGTPPYEKGDTLILERYIQALENNIRENPSGFLWTHNRWKKKHLRPA